MLHGNLTKHCEVDGLLFHNGYVVLLSYKRSHGVQSWGKSFLEHLNHLSLEGKRHSLHFHKQLTFSKQVILIACCALDGGLFAMKPSSYHHQGLSVNESYQSEPKEVSCITIFLHQILKQLPTVKMTPSSYGEGERYSTVLQFLVFCCLILR
jgi:hypothetical protein